MKLSGDTEQVLEMLDDYTKNGLRKRNDMGLLFELGASNGLGEQMMNLIFQGKIIWTLSSKLKPANAGADGIELVQREFEASLEQFKQLINEIANFGDDEAKERIAITYLQMTRGCVLNVIDLSHDLAKFKNMQIELRNPRN